LPNPLAGGGREEASNYNSGGGNFPEDRAGRMSFKAIIIALVFFLENEGVIRYLIYGSPSITPGLHAGFCTFFDGGLPILFGYPGAELRGFLLAL